jgi:hypothetical protein
MKALLKNPTIDSDSIRESLPEEKLPFVILSEEEEEEADKLAAFERTSKQGPTSWPLLLQVGPGVH